MPKLTPVSSLAEISSETRISFDVAVGWLS